ncbi:MAG: ribose-phosphate pyrophosphokinase [Patescibacteria group bacterium]|jgi:ribose-phosphate pyrophosphokinase
MNKNHRILLSGTSNEPLARKIAKELDKKLGKVTIKHFSDGETYVNVEEDVNDQKVYFIQSGSYPTNESLMELLIMLHALKKTNLKPKKVIAVVPFYPYRRMEKTVEVGESLTFELVADLLNTAGIDKIICMDLHKHRSKRFFKFQRRELFAMPVLIDYLRKKDLSNTVLVAPDKGSMPELKKYSRALGIPIVKAYKKRKKHDEAIIKKLVGEVEGKDIIIIDDEINTAGTLLGVVNALKEKKAKDIYFACTHAVLSGPAIERLKQAPLKEVIVTDTINLPEEKRIDKIKILSVAKIFADAIRMDH